MKKFMGWFYFGFAYQPSIFLKDNLRHKRLVETLFYKDKVRLRHKRSIETLFYNDKMRLRHKRSVKIALYEEMRLLIVGGDEDAQNNKEDP